MVRHGTYFPDEIGTFHLSSLILSQKRKVAWVARGTDAEFAHQLTTKQLLHSCQISRCVVIHQHAAQIKNKYRFVHFRRKGTKNN